MAMTTLYARQEKRHRCAQASEKYMCCLRFPGMSLRKKFCNLTGFEWFFTLPEDTHYIKLGIAEPFIIIIFHTVCSLSETYIKLKTSCIRLPLYTTQDNLSTVCKKIWWKIYVRTK